MLEIQDRWIAFANDCRAARATIFSRWLLKYGSEPLTARLSLAVQTLCGEGEMTASCPSGGRPTYGPSGQLLTQNASAKLVAKFKKTAGNESGGLKQVRIILIANLHGANAPTVLCHYALTDQITFARVVVTIVAAIAVGVATVIRAIGAEYGACDQT